MDSLKPSLDLLLTAAPLLSCEDLTKLSAQIHSNLPDYPSPALAAQPLPLQEYASNKFSFES